MRVLLVSIFVLCLFTPAACTQSNAQFLAAADKELGELAKVVDEKQVEEEKKQQVDKSAVSEGAVNEAIKDKNPGTELAQEDDEEDDKADHKDDADEEDHEEDDKDDHKDDDDEEDDEEDDDGELSQEQDEVEDKEGVPRTSWAMPGQKITIPKKTGYKVAKADLLAALAKLKLSKLNLIKVLATPKQACALSARCIYKKSRGWKRVRKNKKDVDAKRQVFLAAHAAEKYRNEMIYKKKYPPLWKAKRQLIVAKWDLKVLTDKKTCSLVCRLRRVKTANRVKDLVRKIKRIRLMIKTSNMKKRSVIAKAVGVAPLSASR